MTCRKNTKSKNLNIIKTRKERITLLSKYTVCDSKTLKFIKVEVASEILSNLREIKVPILSDLSVSIFFLKV